jgi:hypothetical protein
VDIGRAVQYVFQDPNWIKKVLIGGLLLIIPLIGTWIVGGYFIRTFRSIYQGSDTPLPEWDDFGGDLMRGLKLMVVVLVWLAPVWVVSVCVIVPLSTAMDSDAAGLIVLPLQCLISILSIAILFLYPLIISRFAMTEQIGDGLKFGEIFAEAQRYPKELLIVLVVYWVVGIVASFGLILCVIGVLFTSFIAMLIYAHLIGQLRRTVDTMGGPPPPSAAGAAGYYQG